MLFGGGGGLEERKGEENEVKTEGINKSQEMWGEREVRREGKIDRHKTSRVLYIY